MVVRSEARSRPAVLAAKIRDVDVSRATPYSANRVVAIGQWLAEAKADEAIPRGEWIRWVEQEAGLPPKTAGLYMRLAWLVAEGFIMVGDITDLGQDAALKLGLAKARQRAA